MNKLKVPIIIGSIALLFLLAIGIYKVGVANKLFGPKDDINSGNISTKLLDNDEYKDISLDKISYIEIIKYTEGGDEREKITSERGEFCDRDGDRSPHRRDSLIIFILPLRSGKAGRYANARQIDFHFFTPDLS